MSALLKLQQDFRDCMLANTSDMQGQVIGDALAPAEERVGIYVEGYRLRLLEVLQENFTGLHGFLGDEQFDTLGRAYIDAHPSHHPSVRWFSRHLAQFLRDTEPYRAHPYLAELAAFEWAQGLAFDAGEAESLTMEALSAVAPEDWGRLSFRLHPSVQRLDLHWNMPQVWQALDAAESPPDLKEAEAAAWLVWRRDLTTRWRSLATDEAAMLDAAMSGAGFGDLCEGLCRWHAPEAVALQAASYLKLWIADGLVTGIGLG